MKIRTEQYAQTHILYDAETLSDAPKALFDPQALAQDQKINRLGRGAAYLFSYHGINVVMRHYQRGGFMRYVSRDSYFYAGLSNTRMWREFHLMVHLYELGLPVPRPLATRCRRHLFLYSGDLVTQTLLNSQTLAEYLQHSHLSK